jgi:hypothetical protein
MNKKLISLLIAAGLLFGASQSFAAPINATISDWNTGLNSFGGGPFGAGNEDNETEPGTVNTQIWDMEAFVVNGSTLYIVGGYNMQAGEWGNGGSVTPGKLTPGDLFIKVGGANPPPSPTGVGSGDVSNAAYGYSYAIDLTQPVGATGAAATVYSLTASSMFNTVVYDQFGANPWKYSSGGSIASTRNISYTTGYTGAGVDSFLGTSMNLQGGSHNILAIDLGFLSVAAGTQVYFSYTMECGNDSLKGQYGGGFDRVPDGGASALLIGLGLAVMSVVGLKRRQS